MFLVTDLYSLRYAHHLQHEQTILTNGEQKIKCSIDLDGKNVKPYQEAIGLRLAYVFHTN
jgi:hypothetical protein